MSSESTPTTPTSPDSEGRERLKQYNTDVKRRYLEVKGMFTDTPDIDPTKHRDFKAFVASTIATANSWYVMTGKFSENPTGGESQGPGATDPVQKRSDEMEKQGFTVSTPAGKKITLDPLLDGNPAVAAALQGGAFDEDEDESGLSPQTKIEKPQQPIK